MIIVIRNREYLCSFTCYNISQVCLECVNVMVCDDSEYLQMMHYRHGFHRNGNW